MQGGHAVRGCSALGLVLFSFVLAVQGGAVLPIVLFLLGHAVRGCSALRLVLFRIRLLGLHRARGHGLRRALHRLAHLWQSPVKLVQAQVSRS